VPAEVVATDETRPLPQYWAFEQPQHSELDEGEVAGLAGLVDVEQHTVTHCCGSTLRSALARLEH